VTWNRWRASHELRNFLPGGAPALASYAIYVGKNLTTDDSVLIGGSGDDRQRGACKARVLRWCPMQLRSTHRDSPLPGDCGSVSLHSYA
jgi:hypothetical protein